MHRKGVITWQFIGAILLLIIYEFDSIYRQKYYKIVSHNVTRFFQISFPGVRWYTFHKLLCYLYTDWVPPMRSSGCAPVLELGNRLCLPRLITLVEARAIQHLAANGDTNQTIHSCIRLLEPVKVCVIALL